MCKKIHSHATEWQKKKKKAPGFQGPGWVRSRNVQKGPTSKLEA